MAQLDKPELYRVLKSGREQGKMEEDCHDVIEDTFATCKFTGKVK